jgi:hypothetical protein
MAYTTSLATGQVGPSPDGTGLIYEDVTVLGAGDTTGTWTTLFIKQPLRVIWLGTYSISGQTVTIASASLTGTATARVLGYA